MFCFGTKVRINTQWVWCHSLNSIGIEYRVTLIGSSHGNMVGVVVEGVPPNFKIDLDEIQLNLSRRAPGQSRVTTDRKERDQLIVETGIFNGRTTGEPVVAFVRNRDVDSSYYDEIKNTPRPGHADYPAHVKYGGANDYRGSGSFSGRMTIGLVIAGSIAKQILSRSGISVSAYTKEIAGIESPVSNLSYVYENIVRVPDAGVEKQIIETIQRVKQEGDSVGGVVGCRITGLPVGVGEPIFGSIEGRIALMMYGIPATKGVEFGSGFSAARMRGSEHNDEYYYEGEEIRTRTNNAGGILGGLSNGMPVEFRVAFKPTSSISKQQQTVDLETGQISELKVRGRHDPCIVPRAVVVVECAAAITILDLMLRGKFEVIP